MFRQKKRISWKDGISDKTTGFQINVHIIQYTDKHTIFLCEACGKGGLHFV
jgi:hypothetical protein